MRRIHFVGIGGIGMSALARYYLTKDYIVSGSDEHDSSLIQELRQEGVKIFNKHSNNNISNNLDLLIYTEAVASDNPERVIARELRIPEQSYFEALGEITKNYRTIAVAGTHGKSTTTAMLGLALSKYPKTATVFVGTKIFEWGNRNFYSGNSHLLVAEACEYRNSFLNLHPDIIIITTVEAEHLDYFGNEENYFNSFKKFIAKGKVLVADMNDQVIRNLSKDFQGQIINSSDYVDNIQYLQIPGQHNIENASKALGAIAALNLPSQIAEQSLRNFRGTWRRFEKKGEKNGIIVFDDYAHHPTEIQATLRALRSKYPHNNIFCVFQPHQYSRTKFFLAEFGLSFNSVNQVLIPNIYRVRDNEEDVRSVDTDDLIKEITKNKTKAVNTKSFENTVSYLNNHAQQGDIIITMGAGPVNEIAEKYLTT